MLECKKKLGQLLLSPTAGVYLVGILLFAVGWLTMSVPAASAEEVAAADEVDEQQAEPVAVALDEIDVTSSYSMLREEIPHQTLDRVEIMALPHFGDDLYRAVMVLPATSGGDISGRFNVRGGLYGEVLVRLDGLEIFEPFHLKDYQGVFSILDPEVIGGVELLPGSYPAQYGDRMSGVLEMTTLRAAPPRQKRLISSRTRADAALGISPRVRFSASRVLTSMSKSSRAANLIARRIRIGSSLKRISGSPMVRTRRRLRSPSPSVWSSTAG